MNTFLGVDLGGTYVKYGLVEADGGVIERGRFQTRVERGPESALRELALRLEALTGRCSHRERPSAVGVGVAGLVRPRDGTLLYGPNLPGWRDVPVARVLSSALDGMEVRVHNDADMCLLGEWAKGAGRGLNHLAEVTLGTGVGGGLILDGRLWCGPEHTVAEIGHMIIEPQGRVCVCGRRGCLETLASATAVTRMVREWLADGRTGLYTGPPEELTAREICDLARQGDTLALEAFEFAGRALGLALANLFNVLGLEGVVIGGGAAPAYEFLYPGMNETFRTHAMALDPERVRFAPAALGDDAGLVGVSVLLSSDLEKISHP